MLTVHNRRETTLRCLDRLFSQDLPKDATFTAFLVNDGCTDGTPEAIRERFPQVTIIPGDGTLYWNQGMRLAWKTAAEAADWDAYLWLNDDTLLLPGALTTMLETLTAQEVETGRRGIVVGSCRAPAFVDGDRSCLVVGCGLIVDGPASVDGDGLIVDRPTNNQQPTTNNPQPTTLNHQPTTNPQQPSTNNQQPTLTYGGQLAGHYVHPTTHPQPIDRFNGNLVLVSREAHAVLGNLSAAYRHSFGDFDYAIRARITGVPVWLGPGGFQGECPRNPLPKWRNPEVSLLQRWKAVGSPKGWTVAEIKAFARVRGQRFWLLSLLRQAAMVCFPRYARRRQKRFNVPG